MKSISISIISFLLLILLSCGNNSSHDDISNYAVLVSLLSAEKNKDAREIKELFSDFSILAFPDSPPFYTNESISALYAHMWRQDNSTSENYIVDSIQNMKSNITIFGTYLYISNDGLDSLKFKMHVNNVASKPLIDTLLIGIPNLNNDRFHLPKPTGKYKVGLKNFQVNQTFATDERVIGYQVWYPTNDSTNCVFASYRSKEVLAATSSFQGWPSFMVSHFRLIESNSILNANPVKGKKFPLVIYNHGYGGFSSVYQTIFEDLASNGYVVISLGHENESALQILNDSSIVSYNPDNSFYAARQAELNGTKINQLQTIILNSDNSEDISSAYKELVKLSPLHTESVKLWSADTKAVLSEILNNTDFSKIINENKKGVFGHSVGGATAGEICSEPNLFQAGINLDGFQFGKLINENLQNPFLFISSNQEANRFLRYNPFVQSANSSVDHLYIKGFEHSTFTDLALNLNNNREAIDFQREVIKDFFDKHLKGIPNNFPTSYSNHNAIKIYSK